jgi:hypothetical protein
MSMFDSTLAVQNIEISAGPEEWQVLVGFVVGVMMPVVDPQAGRPVGAIPVPVGIHRYPFDADGLRALAQHLNDTADAIPARPKDSGLVIAGDTKAAENLANDLGKFRG